MRKSILILFALSIFHASSAQDSTSISFSEETGDTLIKQRFIDRYEHVFMTKVPTRQMFKIGYSSSEYRGAGFQLGYEYKIRPSLSLEAIAYFQTNPTNTARLDLNHVRPNIWVQARARWYYDMNKRVKSELSASNFSGRYIGVYFDHATNLLGDTGYGKRSSRLGVLYGFQSRFLNRGYIDFAVGLFNRDTWSGYNRVAGTYHFFRMKDAVLATMPTIGIAFGDWKKAEKMPICDVLLCDERIHDQWKVQLPDVLIGLVNQRVETALAYERKVGRSSFSVNASINGWARRYKNPETYKSFNYNVAAELQLRYYLLQKMQIRRGSAGSNFSGPYGGVAVSYSFSGYNSEHLTGHFDNWHNRMVSTPLSLGYQQRFFGKLYLDASVSYTRSLHSSSPITNKPAGFLSRLNIGFTF